MRFIPFLLILLANLAVAEPVRPKADCQVYRDSDQLKVERVMEPLAKLGARPVQEIGRILEPFIAPNPMDVVAKTAVRVIAPLLITRCTEDAARVRAGLFEAPACSVAVTKMANILAVKGGASHPWFGRLPPTVMESEFAELMVSREVEEYLTNLRGALETHEVKNLWSYTLAHKRIAGDKRKAMKWLGLLFRDYPVHMIYYNCTLGTLAAEVVSKVLSSSREVNLLPPPLKQNGAIYHFYTIGYLALRLVEEKVDPFHAVEVAYGLNELYEVLSPKERGNPKDIFLGFAGAAFAFTRDAEYVGYPQEKFISEYPNDPKGTYMRAFIDTLVPNEL